MKTKMGIQKNLCRTFKAGNASDGNKEKNLNEMHIIENHFYSM